MSARAKSTVELPPAGDERRDVLAQREDELAEQAEVRGTEGGRINPKALRVERELAQHFNELDVSNADPAYQYAWIWTGQHGLQIKMKLARKWEVVQGDMPEAQELRGMGADSTRKLGDVILMRIRKDLYLQQKRDEEALRRRQQDGVTGVLVELGERHRHRGLKVHTDTSGLNPDVLKAMESRAAARNAATDFVDENLRNGTMPGRPAPGVQRTT